MSTILVIDDDQDLRRAVRAALTAAGHAVLEAVTAEAGTAQFRHSLPDLVLCDLNLGAGSGLEVLAQLRQDPATATTPLILITASDDTTVMRHGMDLGADDYLHKPFTGEELLAAVEARLKKLGVLKAQAERALRERLNRHNELILNSVTEGILGLDLQGNHTSVNPAAARMLGYTVEELINRPSHNLWHHAKPDGNPYPKEECAICASNRDGQVHGKADEVFWRKDGTGIPVEYASTPISEQGRVLGAVVVFADISERKRQEDALRESERRFADVLHSSTDAILLIGGNTFVDCNEATARLLGYATRKEVLDTHPSELSPPEQPDGRSSFEKAEAMMRMASQQGFHRFEWTHRRANGEDFPVEVSLTPIVHGGKRLIHCVWRDITEHKRAEEQLRQLSKAVEQSPASVAITDTAGRIEYVNPKFCALTGYQPAEVLGQNPRVLKSGETPTETYRELWQRVTAGEEWRGEFRNRKKNGELFWEFAVISSIKDGAGRITHYLAVKEDITERKRRERERDAMELNLRQAQKLESIGQLAAGIAHEINTPMQYIGDNTRFLQEAFGELRRVVGTFQELTKRLHDQPEMAEVLTPVESVLQAADVDFLVEEIPKAIEQSLQGAERVTKIVRAMKEFSHPGTEEKTPVGLNHAIESTITVARNEWKHVAELATDFDPQLPPVPCLPGEFNQVILNLIINAAHAIADVVGKNSGAKGRITISTRRQGEWVEVRVADTGTGIPEAVRGRIFDPFFTTKPVGKGSGQGLAIAHSVIVDKHDGTLTFETEMGRGTTFIIRLPLTASEAAHPIPQP